jgi:hypothetical protein
VNSDCCCWFSGKETSINRFEGTSSSKLIKLWKIRLHRKSVWIIVKKIYHRCQTHLCLGTAFGYFVALSQQLDVIQALSKQCSK